MSETNLDDLGRIAPEMPLVEPKPGEPAPDDLAQFDRYSYIGDNQ